MRQGPFRIEQYDPVLDIWQSIGTLVPYAANALDVVDESPGTLRVVDIDGDVTEWGDDFE